MKKILIGLGALVLVVVADVLLVKKSSHPKGEVADAAAVLEEQQKRQPDSVPSKPAQKDSKANSNAETPFTYADFTAASRTPWNERRDRRTGELKALRNGRIRLPGGDSLGMAREFVSRYARPMFGVDPAALELLEVRQVTREKVIYQQRWLGLEIYGAQLVMIFENGEMVQVSSQLIANPDFTGPIPSDALARARDRFQAGTDTRLGLKTMEVVSGKLLDTGGNRLVLYPGVYGLTLAAIFEAAEESEKGGGVSYVIIEAGSGDVIRRLPASFN